MGGKHCARIWWHHGQHHSSTQVAAESVASVMSSPSFSLFSNSPYVFSPNPSSSRVENTIENVELEGEKREFIKDATSMFKKTCFGYFLDLPPVIVQIRVMHHLLIREVHHEVKNEMRFVVSDSRLHFGLGEFALVTGLKCKGDTSIESVEENKLISKYFGTASVILAQLVDYFTKKKWEIDDDALKIAVLFIF
ncbi:PREDICTED: uncharacterized protein LOC109230034 [Nicotiana attenuata]|uniref:uncharacterized protein LOC109230034 n=1 Tax=Nicotiana attenuata TaxID=49451 RepID=UPI000905D33F|nr:PREDICTED: uncharacterized protein LOC109230034 [Nicotiana attenuata]